MANNRMHLVYQPSGERICIAKRMGFGWYTPVKFDDEALDIFLSKCEKYCALNGSNQDKFILEFEVSPEEEEK